VLTSPIRSDRESAFTLIELVVGMILAVLVLGAVMLAMTSMFSGASDRSVDRKAAARAADVLERFERDARSAESPERLNAPIIRDEMRAIALWGVSKSPTGSVSGIAWNNPCPAGPARAKDYCVFQDITVSNANEIWFRADVDANNPGHECVTWSIQSGALWRQVRSNHLRCYPDDFGGTLSNEKVLDAPAVGSLGNAQNRSASFGFLVRFNRQGMPQASYNGPSKYNTQIDPADCETFTYFPLTSNLTDMRRGFITNITLDLSAWTTGGDVSGTTSKNSARQRLTTSATITSRANDDFAYATGCGQ
jgi:type II secretory pathway pseudopilin PulG